MHQNYLAQPNQGKSRAWERADAGGWPGPTGSEQSSVRLASAARSCSHPSPGCFQPSHLIPCTAAGFPSGNCSRSIGLLQAESIFWPVRCRAEAPAPSRGLNLVLCAGNHPEFPW